VDERLNPIKALIAKMPHLEDADLTRSLRMYLRDGIFGETPIYTRLERHRFVSELFSQSDTKLQERIRIAFSNVLESFEPTNPKIDAEYLFYLVSLASVIRTSQTKERLRRWVRQGTFDTWRHDIFDITAEVILALASYDADDEWVDFLLNVLPKRANFKANATAAFRALWQTRGITCVSLLPDVLLTSEINDEPFVKSVGYLSRLVVDKAGYDQFAKSVNAVFSNIRKPVYETWAAIVRLDYLAEHELSILASERESLTNTLREHWSKTISEWRDLPDEPRYKAFERILDISPKLWQVITSPRGAFLFQKKFILEVADDDYYIRSHSAPFFQAVTLEEEIFYRTARA
jgi:hypothetical protein